jgi:hypothetical protein
MIRDITTKRNYSNPPVLPPVSITNHTTFNTDAMDTQGARGAEMLVVTGAMTGNDANDTITPVLQESNDLVSANYTNVAASDIVGGALPGALAPNSDVKIGYIGMKRYIRIQFVFVGTGISAVVVGVAGCVEFASLMPGTDPSPLLTA